MKILKGDKGNIDFSTPLRLNEEQKERLVNFLRGMFYHVELKETPSFRTERLGSDNPFNKEWEPEEFEMLLKLDEPNEEVSRKLGRTWMGVEMKRIYFIPEMMNFAMKRGEDIYKTDTKKLVREYMKEHQEELLKRKEERKEKRIKEKEIEGLQNEKSLLEEEIPRLEEMIGVGKITSELIRTKKKRLLEIKEILKTEL